MEREEQMLRNGNPRIIWNPLLCRMYFLRPDTIKPSFSAPRHADGSIIRLNLLYGNLTILLESTEPNIRSGAWLEPEAFTNEGSPQLITALFPRVRLSIQAEFQSYPRYSTENNPQVLHQTHSFN